ncbi:hypothetical protein K3495_g16050, partial [Podosphaera aphanis]
MSSLSQPKPAEVAEFKGDDASQWLKSNWSAWIGDGWSQQTVPCGAFIDFLDAHMAQNSPAAHFVDGNKEIQEIIDKDQNSLADVRRLETLFKLKFPKKKVQEEEVSLQSQLDSICQGEKSLRTYYLECVEVVNLLASDLPSSGIPVGNNQIWA